MNHLSTQAQESAFPAIAPRRLIIYASAGDKSTRWLSSISSLITEGIVTEIHRSMGSFIKSLNSPHSAESITVFITENQDDISALTAVREQMSRTKNILVLPDSPDDLFSRALSFYPRFTADINDSPAQACAVLEKMLAARSTGQKENRGLSYKI